MGVFGLSLSSLDVALKTTLMILTIGYTAHKWYLLNKNKWLFLFDKWWCLHRDEL